MKRFFIFAALAVVLMFSGCYDDSALSGRVTELEGRVKALEELCERINSNIDAVQKVLTAYESNDWITSVLPVKQDGKQVGYTITFEKAGEVVIYHGTDGAPGQDGADGQDAVAPVIGLKKDTDGLYYWTVNGEWLTDADEEKVRASAADGKDGAAGQDGKPGQDGQNGVTPKLKIEEGYWYVSYENGAEGTWQMLGKATGEDGAPGQNGTSADAFFEGITESATEVVFTLADGTSFTVLKNLQLDVVFDVDNINYSLGCTYLINYTIVGADEQIAMQVMTSDGLIASYEQTSLEAGVAKGIMTVRAPDKIVERTSLVVLVSNGRGKVMMKALNFIYEGTEDVLRPVFIITSADGLDVAAEGGAVEVPVQTNMNYIVEIEDASKEWLSQTAATKTALREETISLTAAANTGARRYGFVYVIDVADRSLIQTICMVQDAGDGETVQAVQFADTLFRDYMLKHYDLDLDGFLSYEEAEKVTALDISSKKFTDLKGIEHMVNLQTLICDSNNLQSLDLRSNALLEVLDCHSCSQLDTLVLSGNVNLETLKCNNTKIRVLNLSSATKLKSLECYSCGSLTEIRFRDALLLETLNCHSCSKLKNIDLTTCDNLLFLTCYSCGLGTLELSSCKELQTLQCSSNDLEYLDLSACTKLIDLKVTSNSLTYIDLGANPNITHVELSYAAAIKVVGSYITSVKCGNDSKNVLYINSVDFSKCPNLETVRIEKFSGELDLSDLKKLKSVTIRAGTITDMIFDGSENIESLTFTQSYGTYYSSYIKIEKWGHLNLPNLKSFDAYLNDNPPTLNLFLCPRLSKFSFRYNASSDGVLNELILNNGVEIEGVTVNRSTSNIPENTVITYM